MYKYQEKKSGLSLKKIDFYYLMVIGSIGAEYISRLLFTFPIFSLLGALKSLKVIKFSDHNLFYILIVFFANIGIFIKRLFFTPELSPVVNILFVAQLIFLNIFLINYLRKNEVKTFLLLVSSFLYLPHFFGLITGLAKREIDGNGILRFGGFTGDPNYLAIDLIFSLISQVFIIFSNFSRKFIAFSLLNLTISLYLLALTASRTGIIAFAIAFVILLAARILEKSSLLSMIKFLTAIVIFGGILVFAVNNIDRVAYIYYRIFESEGGSSLIENERYIVWGISFDLIQTSDLFSGYGREKFLANQYSFLSHNVFLDMGIVYGKYTFFAHVLFFLVGIILFFKNFLIKKYKFGLNTQTYFFVLCISELIMINSISVSEKYIYWYLMILILVYGYMGKVVEQKNNYDYIYSYPIL